MRVTGSQALAGHPGAANAARRLLAVNVTAVLLLIVQYLLGMAVNVFVVLPGRHPGANAANYFSGAASGLGWVLSNSPAWAASHAGFGLVLVIAALVCIALTWRGSARLARVLAVLGALAIIGAGFNGISFVNYGQAFSSLIMAGLWALALVCYVAGGLMAASRLAR
jgi:hypothetical protein